jgi:hypothetical protein
MLSLTACQAFPPTSRSDADGESAADGGSDSAPPVINGLDALDRELEAQRRERSAPPPKPQQAPPRGELGEKALTGLTTNQTWDLLGPPTQVQEESPATVWTYETAGCRLELFFYFDLESQEQRTLALDLEAASDFVGSRPFCWYTLAKRGRGRETPLPQAGSSDKARDSARVPTAEQVDDGETAADGEAAPASQAQGSQGQGSGAQSSGAQGSGAQGSARGDQRSDANARARDASPDQQDGSTPDDQSDDAPASEDAQAQQDAPAQEESAQ